jgi:hypothetical protein
MAIDFPANPGAQTPVNTFSPTSTPEANTTNSVTFLWDGIKWTAAGSGGGAAPLWQRDGGTSTLSPVTADDNIDQGAGNITTTGDVSAANFTATGDVQTTSLNSGPLAGLRNQLINSDFRVYQRGTSFATSASPQYTLDRWYSIANNGTVTRNNTEGPEGQAFSLQIAPDGSSQRIYQAIELPRPGYAGPFTVGSTWTLSFYAKVFSGSMQVTPRIDFADDVSGNNVTGIQSGSNVTITDTWQRFSSTFTISSAPASTSQCLRVVLNEVSVGASSLFYSMIQLEPGPVATPFEHRPIGTELALCQRYYEASSSQAFGNLVISSGTKKYANYDFKVTKRVDPTCTVTGAGSANPYAVTFTSVGSMTVETQTPEANTVRFTGFTADAEL